MVLSAKNIPKKKIPEYQFLHVYTRPASGFFVHD